MEALVDYASSEDEGEEEIKERPLKRKKESNNDQEEQMTKRSLFISSAASNLLRQFLGEDQKREELQRKQQEEERKRKEVHGGRIRSFPHVEGNYPTHIYIPIKVTKNLNQISTSLLSSLHKEGITNITSMFKKGEYLHISLSRTFALRQHHIKSFVELLTTSMKLALNTKFSASLTSYEWYKNDDNTCSFVGLAVGSGKDKIVHMIHSVDQVLKSFGLPTFYEDPRPHVSIGWTLEKYESINYMTPVPLVESHSFIVDTVECKCGKWTFKICSL